MKRIATVLMLVLLTILAACEKETVLTVEQTSISIPDNGGTQTVSLTANKPWTAGSNQSWCKVSPSGGEEAASNRITITCDANTTYDERTCMVTFTCAEKTISVNVSQATNNGLLVSQTEYELTKAAQQLNIQVQANVKLRVEVDASCKDWVTYNTTKGLTTSTVVLDIAENKTYDSREGKVTIKQDGGSLSSTITIKQSQLDGLFITTPEYNLSNEKHTLTVEVSTNVEFDVTPGADWVKYVQTKGLSTKQIILEVAENNTYDQRETAVNVKQKNGDLSGTIKIKQDEKYGILVSQPEYSLSNEAQMIEVEVKYNVAYDVIIPETDNSWIREIKTKGLENTHHYFSINKNETIDSRTTSVTFKQKVGSLSGTIVINQAQKDSIYVEKTHWNFTYESQFFEVGIKSNIEFDVILPPSADWIYNASTKSLLSTKLSFQLSENTSNFERSENVIIRQNGGGIQKTISIRQKPSDYVRFDDKVFKEYCVTHFDTDEDGEISRDEAKRVKEINIRRNGLSSMKGIECFTNIESLTCSGAYEGAGLLTTLDVSHNNKLIELACAFNKLETLDLSKNKALTRLNCYGNQLTSLDISYNKKLSWLKCGNNLLSVLKTDCNPSLTELECVENLLTSLDVSQNPLLVSLICPNNRLTSLSLSGASNLNYIDCRFNQLTSLDVSTNHRLTTIICDNNQLFDLDVRNNTALVALLCYSNQLTSLDMIANKELMSLNCSKNKMTSLNVSHNPSLARLFCNENQLTSLKVSYNPSLSILDCDNNYLTTLDVSNNFALTKLFCESNLLTTLDLSTNMMLNYLYCRDNPLVTIYLSNTNQLIVSEMPDSTEVKYK